MVKSPIQSWREWWSTCAIAAEKPGD
jgi:hypothetical protein